MEVILKKINTNFQLNISKIMPARPKNTGTWGVHTTVVITIPRDNDNVYQSLKNKFLMLKCFTLVNKFHTCLLSQIFLYH